MQFPWYSGSEVTCPSLPCVDYSCNIPISVINIHSFSSAYMPKGIHIHSLLDGRIYSLPNIDTMAELANALAFSAYDHRSTVYATGISSSPTHHLEHKIEEHEPNPRDRDSGVFLSDTEDALPPTSTPTPLHPSSISPALKSSTTTTSPTISRTDSTARRLRRPAELNLSPASKPKSELELRYDLIRNSQTKSKAALKSPTQLLKDRLNLTPKKDKHDKVRVFTPPQPMLNGCILPGPAAQMTAFMGSNVRARTEREGRPAWWCKFDKLVVFDGVLAKNTEEGEEHGGMKFRTRSSKGLSIARRRGDTEAIIIPLDCTHCQKMLNRNEWKYDVQVCKRGVCWDCRERCRWEVENPLENLMEVEGDNVKGGDVERDEQRGEGNRERADSVLQDEQLREEELMAKVGIETGPRSPIEAVGGIEERLETNVDVEGVK